MPETLGLTLSAGPTKEYKSGGTFSYSTYFADIADRPCGVDSTEKKKSVLTGRTGAGKWLTRVAEDASNAGICPNDIDFGIEFTVTISASGNPMITGITVGDGTVNVDLLGDAAHGTDHELTLSAVPVESSRDSSNSSTASRILTDAASIVKKATGISVSSADFQACTPLGGAVAAVTRRQVDDDTKDSLDRAVGASLLRNIDPSGP